MVVEFLFFDKKPREKIALFNKGLEEAGTDDSKSLVFQISYKDFDGLECWIVKYEIKGNNEAIAKQCSDISNHICQEFSPTVLTDESSEYFNKSLYPLINKFERLLRKFLYLKVSRCDEARFRNVIADIDQKDFGEIYNILFVDINFRAAAREKIKKLNTRAEMYEAIDALQESTAWHILVGDTVLSIIKENFDLLKEYRNDVMHAHNINWEKYKKAKKLYSDANKAIEDQLDLLLQYPDTMPLSEKTASSLYDKLMVIHDNAEAISKGMATFLELFAKMADPTVPKELNPNVERLLQFLEYIAVDTSDRNIASDSTQATTNSEVNGDE